MFMKGHYFFYFSATSPLSYPHVLCPFIQLASFGFQTYLGYGALLTLGHFPWLLFAMQVPT